MQGHLHPVRAQAQPQPIEPRRPAKVVQLEVRRAARLERAQGVRRPHRPAA